MELNKAKYSIGDRVIFQGLVGIVLDVNTNFKRDIFLYALEAEENQNLTCTAPENELEEYYDEEAESLDQEGAIKNITTNSLLMLRQIDNLTDKHHGYYDN